MRNIRDCSVAVVGGAGFLGSHLVNHLIDDRGCKVLVVDNLVAGRREFMHKQASFEHHDITGSEDMLRGIFKQYGIKFCFNYAAYPYVPDSFKRPVHVFNVNAMGAMKVINAAQECGCCEAILQVSSAELYGAGEVGSGQLGDNFAGKSEDGTICGFGELTERSLVYPHSSYGASKAAVDYYCQAAWRERQTPVIALRQFNCVGERETHPYIVPEIISQLAKWVDDRYDEEVWGFKNKPGGPPTLRLGNNSFRDFIYAGDAVKIAVELLERGAYGEVYNLGSETGIKIYDLAKLIGKLMGFSDVIVEQDPARVRPWEIWHLQSDNSKIKSVTVETIGAAGLVPLEEALKRTIAYYESNGRKWCWE